MADRRLRLPFWLRAVFVTLIVGIFSGCATHQVSRDPLKTPLAAGESVVALSITSNTAQVAGIDTVEVQRKVPPEQGVKEYFELKQVVRGLSRDTSLFIGVLPAGDYEVVSLSNRPANKILRLNDSMRASLGDFKVAGGQPVDLGRLIMTPVNWKVIVGRSKKVPSNLAMMQRFTPQEAALFKEPVAMGWSAPPSASDNVEAYALVQPVGADRPVELPDGRVVAAGRLGTAMVRGTNGRWSPIRSAGLESLMHVVPSGRADARFIAVGEFNTLLRQPPDGKVFVPMDTGDMPPGNLLFIDGNDQTGWTVVHQRLDVIRVMRSATLERGHWETLRTESVANDYWNGINQMWIWSAPGGLAYAMSRGDIWRLDRASGQWTQHKSPGDNRFLAISVSPDGTLGAITSPGGGLGGPFASMYISGDQGVSWKEIQSPIKLKVMAPYRFAPGKLVLQSGVSGESDLHVSHDDGLTWVKRPSFTLGEQVTPTASGRLMRVSRGQDGVFSIYTSSTEGESWKLEYTNFDPEAYDRQRSGK